LIETDDDNNEDKDDDDNEDRDGEDGEDGNLIKTETLVVAHIQSINAKLEFTWLAVPTWRLNGLRIGDYENGDRIPEKKISTYLSKAQGELDPDPYYSAWG